VNAFLVIPPASAKLLTRKFTSFLTLGTLLGCFSAIFGMLFSGLFNTSSGPTIVLVQVSIFLGALLLSKVWRSPPAEEKDEARNGLAPLNKGIDILDAPKN
jgi:ABC-type Mn2+/Zn2+ transport system permease subunit